MEYQSLETIQLLSSMPLKAAHALVELAGNFLCSDASLEKLKEEVERKIAEIEEVAMPAKELEKLLEATVWYIETRYSKPYEVSQGELEKFGIKDDVWRMIKSQIKGYRKSLMNVYVEPSGVTSQARLIDFNYEFIINAAGSGKEGSKLLVRIQFATMGKDGEKCKVGFEVTLPEFYELYHELKKAKNLIDMMG